MIESAEEFRRLRESEVPEEYHRAAHEGAKDEVWFEVIRRWPAMRFWVAHNKTISGAVMGALVGDSDARVRHMLACKGRLPAELQAVLVEDDDESVRAALARNRKLDQALHARLAGDPSEIVREAFERRWG